MKANSRLLLEKLHRAYLERRVADGFAWMEEARALRAKSAADSSEWVQWLFCLALWTDVGYDGHEELTRATQQFTAAKRARLPLADYCTLRAAEAFHRMSAEDPDACIEILDVVLRTARELDDPFLIATGHSWKGRAHRRKAEYEAALPHLQKATELVHQMGEAKLEAIIAIQTAWIRFQQGDPREALRLLDQCWEALRQTDDLVSLGNIESARGRIVRRAGEYSSALQHFAEAIRIYKQRFPDHPNLARTLANSAYVKRMIALDLRKRIESRSASAQAGRAAGAGAIQGLRARHQALCQEALEELRRASEIYDLHQHHTGNGAALVNAGYLHLDSGNIEAAELEAAKAYELGQEKHDQILMARARTLQSVAESTRVDEQLGDDEDIAKHAAQARRHADEALELAQHTQNKRLQAGAWLAAGHIAATDFVQDWDLAQRCLRLAGEILSSEDRDHLWEELSQLRARVSRATTIDETLRAWSQGLTGEKTFQEVTEDFAEVVIPKVWMREGRKVSRVAERLSVSPKKVRRILRRAGLLSG